MCGFDMIHDMVATVARQGLPIIAIVSTGQAEAGSHGSVIVEHACCQLNPLEWNMCWPSSVEVVVVRWVVWDVTSLSDNHTESQNVRSPTESNRVQ